MEPINLSAVWIQVAVIAEYNKQLKEKDQVKALEAVQEKYSKDDSELKESIFSIIVDYELIKTGYGMEAA